MSPIEVDRKSGMNTAPRGARLQAYAKYLQSPEWRRTRNRALERVNWRCERCAVRHHLQVHHRNYLRLGAELDTDLEVLCKDCHESHHHEEGKRFNLGIYLKVVSELLRERAYESIGDLAEEAKARCARLKLPYGSDQIERAIVLLDARIPFTSPVFRNAWTPIGAEPYTPISHPEALELCRRLLIKVPFRSIPSVAKTTQRAVDRAKAVQMVYSEIVESIARCEALERGLPNGEPKAD